MDLILLPSFAKYVQYFWEFFFQVGNFRKESTEQNLQNYSPTFALIKCVINLVELQNALINWWPTGFI